MSFVDEYIKLCEEHGLFVHSDYYDEHYPHPIQEMLGRWSHIKYCLLKNKHICEKGATQK
jgi:hypothetical protein